jgi:hypothetical protein
VAENGLGAPWLGIMEAIKKARTCLNEQLEDTKQNKRAAQITIHTAMTS